MFLLEQKVDIQLSTTDQYWQQEPMICLQLLGFLSASTFENCYMVTFLAFSISSSLLSGLLAHVVGGLTLLWTITLLLAPDLLLHSFWCWYQHFKSPLWMIGWFAWCTLFEKMGIAPARLTQKWTWYMEFVCHVSNILADVFILPMRHKTKQFVWDVLNITSGVPPFWLKCCEWRSVETFIIILSFIFF